MKLNSRLDSKKFWELSLKLRKIMRLVLSQEVNWTSKAHLGMCYCTCKRGIEYDVQVAVWCDMHSVCHPFTQILLRFTLKHWQLNCILVYTSNYKRRAKVLYTEKCELEHLKRRYVHVIHHAIWEKFDWNWPK